MECRSCNTPIRGHARACPNCGRTAQGQSLGESDLHQRRARSTRALSPSNAMAEEEEIELNEASVEGKSSSGTAAPKRDAKPKRKLRSDRIPAGKKARSAARAPDPDAAPVLGALALPGPAEVRALIIERPELLETGLQVVREDGGRAAGAGLETEVGEIDLLATDEAGGLVVVMVAASSADKDLVGETLKRIGWVRQHRAGDGQEVRAIVLVEQLDTDLKYSAAAVADTVQFKTYRMSLCFEDIAV